MGRVKGSHGTLDGQNAISESPPSATTDSFALLEMAPETCKDSAGDTADTDAVKADTVKADVEDSKLKVFPRRKSWRPKGATTTATQAPEPCKDSASDAADPDAVKVDPCKADNPQEADASLASAQAPGSPQKLHYVGSPPPHPPHPTLPPASPPLPRWSHLAGPPGLC